MKKVIEFIKCILVSVVIILLVFGGFCWFLVGYWAGSFNWWINIGCIVCAAFCWTGGIAIIHKL